MFLLLLMGLGAAGVSAQVRIGGNTVPNAAAVLDLNANDDATPTGNKGGLALPRVSLASTTAQLLGTTPIIGTIVFNTNASMTGGNGVGLYYWDGSSWTRVVRTNARGPVYVMSLLVDTTFVHTAITAGGYATAAIPEVRAFDICDLFGTHIFLAGVVNGGIQIQNLNTFNVAQESCQLRCFRLIPEN